MHYAISLLLKSQNKFKQTLEIWIKLSGKQLQDDDYPGDHIVYDLISTLKNEHVDLILEYAPFVLKRDVHLGITLFKRSDVFQMDKVLEFLDELDHKEPFRLYLEYAIVQGLSIDSKYSTKLACLYLEKMMQLSNGTCSFLKDFEEDNRLYASFESYLKRQSTPLAFAKLNFIRFIRIQNGIDYSHLMSLLPQEPEYVLECITLLDKMESYSDIIPLFLSVKDVIGAKKYISKLPVSIRSDCLHHLMQSVLSTCHKGTINQELSIVLDIIKDYSHQVNVVEVLFLHFQSI